jgi:hypothetical protein
MKTNPKPCTPRKLSLHWMTSRMRRLAHIKQPSDRQCARMRELEKAIFNAEAK